MKDLHAALKTTVIQEVDASGFRIKHVRLQYARDDFLDTIHVQPSSYSSAGLQSTDLLSFMGFRRSPCAFRRGECYVSVIPQEFDIEAFAKASATGLSQLEQAEKHLQNCGLALPQPEGWGFFFGKPSESRRYHSEYMSGNGHVAPKVQRLKESEDEYFNFIFTWMEGSGAKG